MKFCPKCRGLMVPKELGGKTVLVCIRCGNIFEASEKSPSLYKTTVTVEHNSKEKTVVLSSKEVKGLPVTKDVVCPKCGWREAYYWVVQTRAADEPSTRFFKCVKCSHVWREYE